jgi:hypothetical protein
MPDDEPNSEKEWRSSHDRFVETLERFTSKMEVQQAKQERIANGFFPEISRKELRAHLDARALFYSEEAFKLVEQGVLLPDHFKLADGSPMLGKDAMDKIERQHEAEVENLDNRSKMFTFFASHLPEGKETFILDMSMCVSLELIPNV